MPWFDSYERRKLLGEKKIGQVYKNKIVKYFSFDCVYFLEGKDA